MLRRTWRLIPVLAATVLFAPPASAQTSVGTAFTYQGVLQSTGAPANGTYDIRCGLFDAASAGNQIGPTVCLDNVPVAGGLFTVSLDFGAVFQGVARWLELSVRADTTAGNCASGAFTTLAPRQALTPTPYADGLSLPQNLFTSITGPALTLTNFGGGDSLDCYASGAGRSGVYGVNSSSDGYAVYGRNTGSTDIGILGLGTIGVYGEDQSSTGAGGWFESSNAAGRGLVGQNYAASGSTFGVVGMTSSLRGTAVYGTDSQNVVKGSLGTRYPVGSGQEEAPIAVYGVLGAPSGTYTPEGAAVFGDSSTGPGVIGFTSNDGTTTYNPMGVWGLATSATGITYGVYGGSESTTGIGVYGRVSAITGLNYGVEGECDSDSGRAVFGRCNSTTGTNYGVWGESPSTNGRGVIGKATALTGTTYAVVGQNDSATGLGVFGYASDAAGVNYGVYGLTNSPAGYGGYFLGRGYFSDNVGLGVLQPTVPLQVAGGTDLTLSGGGNIVVGTLTGSNLVFDNNEIQARSNGGAASLYINANGGNVAIGAGNAQGFQLLVSGTAAKPGGGSWSTISDARLKKNIQPLTGTLDKLLQLRGVTFEYIDPTSINELPGTRTGMLAQEVEQVFPDWVDQGPDGMRRVTFRGFEALTVEALRDLKARQDNQVAEKDAEIARLSARLDKLESIVAALTSQTNPAHPEIGAAR